MNENVLLYGSFYIYENIVVTLYNKMSRERIIGYGNKDIMNAVYLSKLNFNKFKESSFMKNKIIQNTYSFSSNNNTFNISSIFENEKRTWKLNPIDVSEATAKRKSGEEDKITINTSVEDESEEDSENVNDENTTTNNNVKKVNYFFEETMSQASTVTSNNNTSFWNLNKSNLKNDNHFSSKSFLNLQILLVGLLLILLVLIIISVLNLKILKNTISTYSENFFDLRQFVRFFQQFSYSFTTLICIVKSGKGKC